MATATFNGTRLIHSIFKLFGDLVGDGNIHFQGSGIYISSMDDSHVCLLRALVGADIMSSYECDEATTVGVQFKLLSRIINSFSPDSTLTLEVSPGADSMAIRVRTEDGNNTFAIKLMDIESDSLEVPDMEYTMEMDIPFDKFKARMEQAEKLEADTIQFKYDGEGKLIVHYETNTLTADVVVHQDRGGGSDSAPVSGAGVVESPCGTEPVGISIASKYPRRLFGAGVLSPMVSVGITNGIPMKVRCNLTDGDSYVELHIAPKIDDEDTYGGGDGGEEY